MLYDRHGLLVDFTRFGQVRSEYTHSHLLSITPDQHLSPAQDPPLYMNLLRDPLKVQLSAFYFWRECVCRRGHFCADAWQPSSHAPVCGMDIDQVYESVVPRPAAGVMTRYFCGQHPVCKAADPLPAAMRAEVLRRCSG